MASNGDAARYLLTRTRAESDRLDLQHHAFQKNLGFLLHPAIPQHDHMRIADIGTGTGVWLRDLAGKLPTTCIFDGFDISLDQVPDKALFSADINYYVQDILAPFPAEFIGQYDAVHVRLLVMGLKVDEWERAVRNLMTLLRPGGYLQWADVAALDGSIVRGTRGCNVNDAQTFLKQFTKVISIHGKSGRQVIRGPGRFQPLGSSHTDAVLSILSSSNRNVTELCSQFKKCGLKDCKEDIVQLDKPEYKAMVNANFVKAIEHVLQAASLAAGHDGDAPSMDQIAHQTELAVKNLEETKSFLHFDLYVVIGRHE